MKKNKTNLFTKILVVLFIMFLCLYSISANGYIEGVNKKKTLFVEEQIKSFENDVENGEYLNNKDYSLSSDVNYSNRISEFGESLSETISYTAKKTLELTQNLFSYLFE